MSSSRVWPRLKFFFFGQLDGNVSRLISRFLAIHAPPKSKASLDLLWRGAQAMVEGATCAGDVNQALIELGSTVCKPRDPDCSGCPLRRWCRARQISEKEVTTTIGNVDTGDIEDLCNVCDPIPVSESFDAPSVTSYPMKIERKKQREELNVVSVVEWRNDGDRWFLLTRRPEGGASQHRQSRIERPYLIFSPQDFSRASRNSLLHLKYLPRYLLLRKVRLL